MTMHRAAMTSFELFQQISAPQSPSGATGLMGFSFDRVLVASESNSSVDGTRPFGAASLEVSCF
jgi:hypothetical protein